MLRFNNFVSSLSFRSTSLKNANYFIVLAPLLFSFFFILPFILWQNSWYEWQNILFFIANQKQGFQDGDFFNLSISTNDTGLFYPLYLFYGPVLFTIAGWIPFSSFGVLVFLLVLFFAIGGLGINLIASALDLKKKIVFTLSFTLIFSIWNSTALYRGGALVTSMTPNLIFLVLGLLFSIFRGKINIKFALLAGFISGVLPGFHMITAYLIFPIILVTVGPLIQAISSNYVNAAKIWRYYFISFVSSGFLFWYFQLLNSPKTVAGKAEPLALPNGRLRNLAWDLFLNQSYFISILINCLFLIAVLTHTFPYKKANLLWYGVLSTIISFSTLAFQSQFFQTVWNVASFITGPLQGPDRFQYINILTSVLSSALLIHFANLDNASPLVIKFSAVSLAFLVMASMSSINIAYTTKANSLDTKLMTISEIQDELRPPPHFRKGPFQAAIVQYLMVGYSPYNGSKPIKDLPELFFKLNDSNHASTAVSSPGLYKTNLIASPFLRISNAKFEGTDDGDGFAVIRVTENGIVYAEFGF